MKDLIDRYIADQKLAWSPTTLRSELYRLRGVSEALDGNPLALWGLIEQTQKPYARLTTWTRVTSFWQWLLDHQIRSGENAYATFRRKNARLFKNVYETKLPEVSFEEAIQRIKQLEGPNRSLALQIIASGERFSESIQPGNRITGKGSKRRHTYRPDSAEQHPVSSYASFRRALRAVGLKPHDLRKLCATRLVEVGATDADLMKAMGWSSITTAKSYLIPKNVKEMGKLFTKVQEAL